MNFKRYFNAFLLLLFLTLTACSDALDSDISIETQKASHSYNDGFNDGDIDGYNDGY